MGSLFKAKKSLKTIFFDVGGVVVSAPMANYAKLGTEIFNCDEETLNRATAELLPPLERGQIDTTEFWTKLSDGIAQSGKGQAVPAWKFKGFWEGLLTDSLRVDQDFIDMVRRLKAHITVAVLSNVIKEHAKILQKHEVYQHFNPVILSCKLGERKPDAEAFHKACKLAKTTPERSLLVDDCPVNIAAAEKLGFRTFLYTDLDSLKRELYDLGFLD